MSEDPAFLAIGNPGQLQQLTQQGQVKFLIDPQQLNSYSYGRDNPITLRDPNGLFIPEAVIGGVAGGIIGGLGQAYGDSLTGKSSGWKTYIGAITGGATTGAVIGATDGASLFLAGAQGGAVQSIVTQGLGLADGGQKNISMGSVLGTAGTQGIINAIPLGRFIPFAKLTAVDNAVAKQLYPKLSNGTIGNVSASSYFKNLTGSFLTQAPNGAAQSTFDAASKTVLEPSSKTSKP